MRRALYHKLGYRGLLFTALVNLIGSEMSARAREVAACAPDQMSDPRL
jgi:hypothetical protein